MAEQIERCSFCGKTHAQVDRLIAGEGVFICNECIELCNQIMEEDTRERQHRRDDKGESLVLPKPQEIKAQLDDFVRSLPGGLDNNIGERGVRISGGQRQRLGIARALYTNPQVLVFDEATAALDQETESAIIESINALHGKKTMIIIAHRLTTIEDCDVIYQVENGKIMETTL